MSAPKKPYLRLQPHQTRLRRYILATRRFPFYICWGMGSGKTIGGIVCASVLSDGDRMLVICDKSVRAQWRAEVDRVLASDIVLPRITVVVEHYESLDRSDAPDPGQFGLTIVDEAHRFRNAWATGSERMLGWIERIQRCRRVVYMSGTPIVYDARTEYDAFCRLLQSEEDADLVGRVSCYDPRCDPKHNHHYASIRDEIVECPMSWAQTFLYLQYRRQRFRLTLDNGNDAASDTRERISSSKNAYGTMLRSISNCPFKDSPELSPKMAIMIDGLLAHERRGKRQLVYSSRRDTGVDALMRLWQGRTANARRVFRVDGSMSITERASHMQGFNRAVRASVLFITDAGAQGIDCKRVDVVHIMEPSDSLQDERQTINRAVRYKAHVSRTDPVVLVRRYVSAFPVTASVAPPWKQVLFQSGMFDRSELKGITRRVQYALKQLIRSEEVYETIDQRTLCARQQRDEAVQVTLNRIEKCDRCSSSST